MIFCFLFLLFPIINPRPSNQIPYKIQFPLAYHNGDYNCAATLYSCIPPIKMETSEETEVAAFEWNVNLAYEQTKRVIVIFK